MAANIQIELEPQASALGNDEDSKHPASLPDNGIHWDANSPLQRRPLHRSSSGQPLKGRGSLEEAGSTKPYVSLHQHAALPCQELLVYAGVIAFLFVYIHQHIHQLSKEKAFNLKYLSDGWSLFGQRKKDVSHDQWTAFVATMTRPSVVLSYIAYITLGQLVLLAPRFRKVFMLLFSTLWIYRGLGIEVLGVLLLHSFIVYVVSHSRRQLLVWATVLLAISSVLVDPIIKIQERYLGNTQDGTVCILISSLRLLCFGLEFCRKSKAEKPSTGYNLFDLLLFNFYLPVFPYGPLVSYDTFLAQINAEVKPLSEKELKMICREIIRCVIWAALTEGITHFLYFGAMTNHYKTLTTLDAKDLSFLALYHLFFFQLSTFVPYSFSGIIALFDRIDVPQPPICILSIHFFRDMWRYFDRGLNAMLTKYIYIPLGGSQHGPLRQSLAALVCFLFVAFWHGGGQIYLTWALLNWIGVQVETAALAFSRCFGPLQKLQKSMSPAMLRRFYAACAVPNYLFLAVSNLVFVIGPSKTRYFVYSMIFKDWPWNILGITVAFYCCMQVVNEVERRVGKKLLLSKKYL